LNRWRKKCRVIPRLDVRGPNVIKGIQLEGVRVVGLPGEMAHRYYEAGADEILYMDAVASLYGRENLVEIVERASRSIFVPLTAGGGVRRVENVRELLRAGADKVAINSAGVRHPDLIREASQRFGAQCIVVSIEAKSTTGGRWEVYCDNGREKTGLDVVDWSRRVVDLGAGEILLTSVDREGGRRGFDLDLIRAVAIDLPIPVIACGGAGHPEDGADAIEEGKADAVAVASILHHEKATIGEIKGAIAGRGLEVRR
jgi:cyclase